MVTYKRAGISVTCQICGTLLTHEPERGERFCNIALRFIQEHGRAPLNC